MNILILCTGNSCRSQMAEALLKSFDGQLNVQSSGTHIASEVNPKAIQVMNEIDIDLANHYPKQVDQFLNDNFDFVITVCDHAKEDCPVFFGLVKQQIHIGFSDPALATGSETEILNEFRLIRDQIKDRFQQFYQNELT